MKNKKNKKKDNNEISFLGKIILFFRTQEEKHQITRLPKKIVQKQKDEAGYQSAESSAEAKISYGFGMTRICALTVLCIFLAVVLLFGGSIMSYENVYYMFKDISYISTFSETRPETLSSSPGFGGVRPAEITENASSSPAMPHF